MGDRPETITMPQLMDNTPEVIAMLQLMVNTPDIITTPNDITMPRDYHYAAVIQHYEQKLYLTQVTNHTTTNS